MVDWITVVFTGFAMGIGSESSKIVHEIWIKPHLERTGKILEKAEETKKEVKR